MTDIYIHLLNQAGGAGTENNPYLRISSAPTGNNNTYKIKRDTDVYNVADEPNFEALDADQAFTVTAARTHGWEYYGAGANTQLALHRSFTDPDAFEEIDPRLREMAILMAARHWMAHYEWNAHKNAALMAGLDPDIVAAIAAGERPKVMQANEAALHRFCSELLTTKRVSDETFAATKAAFGEQGMTEIVFTLGYYSLVSMLLNVDEHPLPEGVQVELKPLPN